MAKEEKNFVLKTSVINIYTRMYEFYSFMLNVPVNNFSVMLGGSHRFLGITSTFGGKYTQWPWVSSQISLQQIDKNIV